MGLEGAQEMVESHTRGASTFLQEMRGHESGGKLNGVERKRGACPM